MGWREDNRAFIIASSFGGGKVKPEEMFDSLLVIKTETTKKGSVAEKFFEKFSGRMTEKGAVETLQ